MGQIVLPKSYKYLIRSTGKNLEATLLFVVFSSAFNFLHREKMEQILQAYGFPQKTITVITVLYKDTKTMIRSLDGETDVSDIYGVLQGETLAP